MEFSELRQDAVSGEWVLIAPRRGARPHTETKKTREVADLTTCFFEDPEKASGKPVILKYESGGSWTLQIIENKFPAFQHREICAKKNTLGPYAVAEGIGHHDLLITRSHTEDFPDLVPERAAEVMRAFREYYHLLLKDNCLAYISFFHNWGRTAGASVYHPHYQMIATPIVPHDVQHSLDGSSRYMRKHKTCVHCAIINWEREAKERIVFENEKAIALTPFASRGAFEMRVFPKAHAPYFEESDDMLLVGVSEVLQQSLKALKIAADDPDYNFFIHTSPIVNNKRYRHYHWHIEIVPKVSIPAGFELSTGLDINPMDPNEAAQRLREALKTS